MATPKPPRDPLALIGKQVLARYTVREAIATGGMSVIYASQDDRLQRPVCLKVFYGLDPSRPEYETAYRHFMQEVFALSHLQHPNTIRLYDFGYLEHAHKPPFYVCELLNGGTLSQRIARSGPLAPAEALEILEPIVRALTEAHGRGIVHRDIKPSNILFGTVGKAVIPKLADFGIAKAMQMDLPSDARGELPYRAPETFVDGRRFVFCSPSWSAPEQLRGEAVGPAADIYSLGLVFICAITGKRIYSEENLTEALLNRVASDDYLIQAVSALNLPRPLAQELLKACSSDSSKRHASAEAFLQAMRRAIRSERATSPELPAEAKTERAAEGPRKVTTGPKPVLVLARLSESEVVAAGRRVRLIRAGEAVELSGEGATPQGASRFQLTFLPIAGGKLRIHLKGINCFLAKDGGRQTNACTVEADGEVELRAPGKGKVDAVRCQFGLDGAERSRVFAINGVVLGVPEEAAHVSVLLDFGPGRDLALVYSAPAASSGNVEH